MRALRILVDSLELPEKSDVIDFGCGDGMYISQFFEPTTLNRVVGVDVSGPMIEIAKSSLQDFPFEGLVGDENCLADIEGQFDLAFAIDVLGYLDERQLGIFYRNLAKLLRPGGYLVVMYGNELFDMFALNNGTCTFFEKHFDLDVQECLTQAQAGQYKPANRKNPLSFGAEIAKYGFAELQQSYSQWHRIPPAIGNRADNLSEARMAMRDHSFDANALPNDQIWTAKFRCSIFASLSKKI
jgi:SAM-dependent methyltransferase